MAQVVPVDDDTIQILGKRRCSCRYRPLACLAVVLVVTLCAICLAVWQPWRGRYAPSQPARLSLPSVFPNSTTVYLGNGCFWERQYAYTNIELACTFVPPATTSACSPFSRSPNQISSKAGYAGGVRSGLACYDSYEDMGHAEVVSVELEEGKEMDQWNSLLVDFFGSFLATSRGMIRPDSGDKGSAYRSLLAFPGGITSSWFDSVRVQNVHNMQLKPATGGEPDEFNTVWIMDSDKLLYVRAEQYHQFHSNFIGARYPDSYLYDLWSRLIDLGSIPPTGCSEEKHW